MSHGGPKRWEAIFGLKRALPLLCLSLLICLVGVHGAAGSKGQPQVVEQELAPKPAGPPADANEAAQEGQKPTNETVQQQKQQQEQLKDEAMKKIIRAQRFPADDAPNKTKLHFLLKNAIGATAQTSGLPGALESAKKYFIRMQKRARYSQALKYVDVFDVVKLVIQKYKDFVKGFPEDAQYEDGENVDNLTVKEHMARLRGWIETFENKNLHSEKVHKREQLSEVYKLRLEIKELTLKNEILRKIKGDDDEDAEDAARLAKCKLDLEHADFELAKRKQQIVELINENEKLKHEKTVFDGFIRNTMAKKYQKDWLLMKLENDIGNIAKKAVDATAAQHVKK